MDGCNISHTHHFHDSLFNVTVFDINVTGDFISMSCMEMLRRCISFLSHSRSVSLPHLAVILALPPYG